jgi:hypothetical protein
MVEHGDASSMQAAEHAQLDAYLSFQHDFAVSNGSHVVCKKSSPACAVLPGKQSIIH